MEKKLAIIGHPLEGDKVIEILKMLGGRDVGYNGLNSQYYYYIDEYGNIAGTAELPNNKILFVIYTLKEFLEKFPYKVGDKVIIEKYYGQIFEILSARWCNERNIIMYQTSNGWYYANELQLYKEETMKNYLVTEEDYGKTLKVEQEYLDTAERLMDQLADGTHWKCKDFDSQKMIALFLKKNTSIITEKEDSIIVDIPKGYEFTRIDDDNQKVVFEKIGCQYPKTYEECCEILNYIPNSYDADEILVYGYMCDELRILQKLLICRDAYWKIAGEQMGLGKPWEPDFTNDNEERYGIYTIANKVEKDFCGVGDVNMILTFPTEEMRDAFLDSEEIAQLIESCKEFL